MTRPADAGRAPVPALAEFATTLPSLHTLADLLDAATAAMLITLEADSAHVGRLETSHGRLRILRNAGRLAAWEEPAPDDETYLLTERPQLLHLVEDVRPRRCSLADPGTGEHDRAMLRRQDRAHSLSVRVFVQDGAWGELRVTRAGGLPFTVADEEVATVLAGLFAAGLARVLGDERLRQLAYTDSLTTLANRRAADEQLEAWATDPATAGALTVVLCDVNGLKQVNDQHGHLVGDRLIQDVAVLVSAAAGRLHTSLAARIGGDEFLVAAVDAHGPLVDSVVDELVESAAALPFGDGVSCGVGSADALLRPEDTPQSLVRSLLRIADSEQYRHKLALRVVRDSTGAGRPAAPAADPPALDVLRAEVQALRARADPGEQTSVEARLGQVAQVVCELAQGVGWWVSEVDLEVGTAHTVSYAPVRVAGVGDGLWPAVENDPVVYELADFPATERAVREAGVFCVDTLTGDPAERHLLIQTGYQSMIAAGLVDSGGRGWLVEVCGDSLTRDLQEFALLLHTAVGEIPQTVPAPAPR